MAHKRLRPARAFLLSRVVNSDASGISTSLPTDVHVSNILAKRQAAARAEAAAWAWFSGGQGTRSSAARMMLSVSMPL